MEWPDRSRKSPTRKLTPDRVLELYAQFRAGVPQRTLGALYGVSHQVVGRIGHGQHWSWLTGAEPRPQWVAIQRAEKQARDGDGRRRGGVSSTPPCSCTPTSRFMMASEPSVRGGIYCSLCLARRLAVGNGSAGVAAL